MRKWASALNELALATGFIYTFLKLGQGEFFELWASRHHSTRSYKRRRPYKIIIAFILVLFLYVSTAHNKKKKRASLTILIASLPSKQLTMYSLKHEKSFRIQYGTRKIFSNSRECSVKKYMLLPLQNVDDYRCRWADGLKVNRKSLYFEQVKVLLLSFRK